MNIYDDVKEALKPLREKRILHEFLPGPSASYGQGSLVEAGTPVTLLLNTDEPESYRAECERLLLRAGLKDIRLTLHTNHPPV